MPGFSPPDRALLLGISGLGPQTIRRLEEAGIDSLEKLRLLGADRASELVCAHLGTQAWRNRRKPIERALGACIGGRGPAADAAAHGTCEPHVPLPDPRRPVRLE